MENISLMELLQIAVRRIWILILTALVFAAAAFSYCRFLAVPKYTATASILVTNGAIITQDDTDVTNFVSATDISASIKLAYTIIGILQTNDIYKDLSLSLGNSYSYSELRQMSSISRRDNDSLFIDVSFSCSDPQEAKKLVNAFVVLTPDYITEFVPYSNASVVSLADSSSKTYPKTSTTTFIAAILGGGISFVFVFILDLLDKTIKGEEDFKSRFDIPIIGAVPDFENVLISSSQKGGYHTNG